MAIRKINPTTPGQRGMTVSAFEEITRTTPEKSLTTDMRKRAGRNFSGRITVRHQGGGAKRKYRIIDFKRNKDDVPGKIFTIEYDPNRSANIALVHYADGEKRYIIAPLGLNVGDQIVSGAKADIKIGNTLPLENIPVGTMIHCVELVPGKGAQLVPSGEVRLIPLKARATIGQVGNVDFQNIMIGKAGRTRHMGIRPTVRGSVMNPNDHPHGGGEGKSPIGRPGPVTPWGKPALGYKTRKTKNKSNKYIVRRRNGGK